MVVIIPHQTQLLKFSRFQKELVKNNFIEDSPILKKQPLWIPLPDNNCSSEGELKNFSKEIKSLTVFAPECKKENNFYKTILPVQLELIEGSFSSELLLTTSDFLLKKLSTEEFSFPLCLKVFRIGKAIKPSANSQSIAASVWKKL